MHSNFNNVSGVVDYEQDELCDQHAGEITIAVDTANPEIYGCNKCVFEKRLQRPRFLVAAAKKVKRKIDV